MGPADTITASKNRTVLGRELSPGCLTTLTGLTSPEHGKFKFETTNPKTIAEREMRLSLRRKRFSFPPQGKKHRCHIGCQ